MVYISRSNKYFTKSSKDLSPFSYMGLVVVYKSFDVPQTIDTGHYIPYQSSFYFDL